MFKRLTAGAGIVLLALTVSACATPAGSSVETTPSATATTAADRVEMPDVVGKTLAEAETTLADAGLVATYPNGVDMTRIVESQGITAGLQVRIDTEVFLSPATHG
ncbi:PASTA domain-containing protein [Microbacterium sp. W1N]|uniref:PASTA domain-containing protein n=1 Tax=Microbacterium festucae TaxID=2977531 RepID=UPI0021BFA0E8|nr:PASTA domain-containing protein [Microbacterium festucae]MCT9820250.1 PASTA domain-containing protein [Microbacterium festucae]